jgi:hypothetical protein
MQRISDGWGAMQFHAIEKEIEDYQDQISHQFQIRNGDIYYLGDSPTLGGRAVRALIISKSHSFFVRYVFDNTETMTSDAEEFFLAFLSTIEFD